MRAISIIVPTLNESDNIEDLVSRISATFRRSGVDYEIVFVDDNSTDGTQQTIKNLPKKFPVRLLIKDGERGKAQSLLQGFAAAHYDTICMIDADLQYPPEAILPMYRLMQEHNVDVVLTERQYAHSSWLRQLSSKVFNLAFTQLLFGFNYDSQSGLKLFKK
ncbi:MAG TPA: glycosyltransferase family 2 protein, partial [Candidatus Limnocylindrales bacterium]|nr:glycosyltransferase family 2 protein [Candidatus Limnocylindrales bacterium]